MNFLKTLTGCFAQPVAENPTVVMMEAAFAHHGIDARYINCEVPPEKLGDAVRGARAMGWVGFNCSLPHKVAVMDHLDGLGRSAEIMQAVNCAVMRDGRLIGENTDGQGFLTSLRGVTDPSGRHVLIFGAGGAARAIAVELALAGVGAITIVNRDPRRGEELAALVSERTPVTARFVPWKGDHKVGDDVDIVVNATSIGLFPDVNMTLDLVLASLRPGLVVADVIPNPPRTKLIRDAEARGCTVLDGLGMLVNQGVLNIKYWTGVDADATVMRKSMTDLFGV
jgi:shikimate dehydrogenase